MAGRLIVAACVLGLAVPSPASSQDGFQIDVTPQEALDAFLTMDTTPRLGDLAVGERGFISPFAICYGNGEVGISEATRLSDPPSRFIWNLEVERHPGNQLAVSVAVEHSDNSYSSDDLLELVSFFVGTDPSFGRELNRCADIVSAFPGNQILLVSTLDGYSSVSEWLGALQSGEHPIAARVGWGNAENTESEETANVAAPQDDAQPTTQPAHINWLVTRGSAAIDDSPEVLAIKPSTQNDQATIAVNCMEGQTRVLFGFGQYMIANRNDTLRVEYRLDAEAAERDFWSISTSNQYVGLWGGGSVSFIRRLLSHDQIYIRVTERNGERHSATFALNGLDDIATELASACSWDAPALTSDEIRRAQRALAARGFYGGLIDGQWGPMSRRALIEYQRDQGLEPTGILDSTTWSRLDAETPTQESVSPPTAPAASVDRGSDVVDQPATTGRLTRGQHSGVLAAIRPCWNIDPAARDIGEVQIRVTLRRDRSVVDAEVVDRARYNSDPAFRAAANRALRAALNPACQPWPLPPERWPDWQTIVFGFDPRDVF
ncbi:MAG: hypothetical protein GVY13_01675 [Alphaproteobacteria bacterium]|nr:hypothetical protein [Alphaproteobacteria bacterium]